MRKLSAVAALCCIWIIAPANTQQVDVAFGGGSLSSAGSSFNLGNFVPSEAGGTFVGFSGNVLIKGDLGAEGEVFWRASQNLYAGQIPDRPVFWDFSAIYAPRFNRFLGAEVLAGIGAESVRFYSGNYNCDIYGNCSNYVSSNHFMGDVGRRNPHLRLPKLLCAAGDAALP